MAVEEYHSISFYKLNGTCAFFVVLAKKRALVELGVVLKT